MLLVVLVLCFLLLLGEAMVLHAPFLPIEILGNLDYLRIFDLSKRGSLKSFKELYEENNNKSSDEIHNKVMKLMDAIWPANKVSFSDKLSPLERLNKLGELLFLKSLVCIDELREALMAKIKDEIDCSLAPKNLIDLHGLN